MNLYKQISKNNFWTVVLVFVFPLSLLILLFLVFFVISEPGDERVENWIKMTNAEVEQREDDPEKLGQAFDTEEVEYRTDGYYKKEHRPSTQWESALILLLFFSPYIFGGALIWMAIAYYWGGNMLLSSAHAREIRKRDNPEVYRLTENISIASGLPMPKIYIINDESLNAFATGRDPENASIALTTGIIRKLNKQELEGVIAHEMAHIGNRDIRLMLLIIFGIGFFAFVGEVLLRSTRHVGRGKNSGGAKLLLFLMGIVFMIFAYVLAPLIRLAISRQREYLADATGALITRNPEGLASALEKISQDARVESLDSRPTAAAICIENPRTTALERKSSKRSFIGTLFATHPAVEDRVRALRGMTVKH